MLLAGTLFEAPISVSNINSENNSFSISTPGYCSSIGGAETLHKLQKFLELRSQNDIDLHVEEVTKKEKENRRQCV